MTITPVNVTDITVQELCDRAAADWRAISCSAEEAFQVASKVIRLHESIAKGKLLIQLRNQIPRGEFTQFLSRDDVGISSTAAYGLMAVAELYDKYGDTYGQKVLEKFSSTSLVQLSSLSDLTIEHVLSEAVNSSAPTIQQIRALSNDPEIKLLKAEQDERKYNQQHQKALKERDSVRSDPQIKHDSKEYQLATSTERQAKRVLENAQKKVAELQAQLAQEQAKTSAAQAEKVLAEEKLEKALFDEDTAVSLQIKRVGYNLQNMVPQVLADLQRFTAEKQRYPETLRLHIEEQVTQLLTYLSKHYA